ncbi:HD domain-containing protein, partial [Globicatella sulfidifaciens]
MDARKFLEILSVAECLKDTTRHCYTSKGRHESVAEHTWMMSLMAFFLRDEFPEVDFQKVMLMIIIHDLGECFTGDIPAFEKNDQDRESEEKLLHQWIAT